MECYAPVEIAERCFLSEAILWLLLREVPICESFSLEGEDARFSLEREGEGGHVADLTGLTPHDCEKIGISPNPAEQLEDFSSDRVTYITLDQLDGVFGKTPYLVDKIYKKHTKEEIEEARKMKEDYDKWVKVVEIAMELPKVKILQAILNGDLPVFCRNRIDDEIDLGEDEDEDEGSNNSETEDPYVDRNDPHDFVKAPIHIIKAKNIDWQLSCSTIDKLNYQDICVDTMTLLRLFPDPNEHIATVSRVGDVLFPKDDDLPATNRPQRGRPSLPWAEMHQELGRRIERGIIPDKKEALVAELMDWCRTKWGRVVSRSAIQSQLRNFRHAQKP